MSYINKTTKANSAVTQFPFAEDTVLGHPRSLYWSECPFTGDHHLVAGFSMNGEFKNWSIRNDQADRLRPLRRKAFINLGKYWVETFTDKNGEADFRLVKAKSNRNEKGGSK